MIATAILTLGLVSVLALFPVAIHTGKTVMDQSTAVVIGESVAEAIREGMRNHLRSNELRSEVNHYFIFKHDGVLDRIPNDKRLEKADKDYYILLPHFPERGASFSGRSEEYRRRRALQVGKVFVYPESDPLASGGGRASRADNDGDDFRGTFSTGAAYRDILVSKTYPLGTLLPELDASGIDVLEDQQIENLKQFSFAFAVRVSKFDSNLSQNSGVYEPGSRLFNFHVMVFRNFVPPVGQQKHQEPVFELNFEVAI